MMILEFYKIKLSFCNLNSDIIYFNNFLILYIKNFNLILIDYDNIRYRYYLFKMV